MKNIPIVQLPTLDSVIEQYLEWRQRNPQSIINRNTYVRYKGFADLYIRIGRRYIDGVNYQVIDLANMRAHRPGKGAFTCLIEYLQIQYPLHIYVECVLGQRFRDKLLRMGFTRNPADAGNHINPSFYLLSSKKAI